MNKFKIILFSFLKKLYNYTIQCDIINICLYRDILNTEIVIYRKAALCVLPNSPHFRTSNERKR